MMLLHRTVRLLRSSELVGLSTLALCAFVFSSNPVGAAVHPTGNYSCHIGIVGGGAGGIYTAMRLAESGSYSDKTICVFERTNRVGGRIMSVPGLGPQGDHIVDAGAYRFSTASRPINDHLVRTKYALNSEQYVSTSSLHVILDDDGKHAG